MRRLRLDSTLRSVRARMRHKTRSVRALFALSLDVVRHSLLSRASELQHFDVSLADDSNHQMLAA
jgi:hypothetical protein